MKKLITASTALLAGLALQASAATYYETDQLVVDYNMSDSVQIDTDPDVASEFWIQKDHGIQEGTGYFIFDFTVELLQDLNHVGGLFDWLENTTTYFEVSFAGDTTDFIDAGTNSKDYGSLLAGVYDVQIITDSAKVTADISAVPIPAAALLFGTALLGFAGFGARRKV